MTDKQWRLIEPLLPAPRTDGRPEKHPRENIVGAIFSVLRTGCSWRQLPDDLPPWQTVYWYFKRWRDDGGRDAMASAGIVDAQSVKGADTVGRRSHGYDAGKRVNYRKRPIVVDTFGLLLLVVAAAIVQDRDGGTRVLERLRFAMPSVATLFADGGYADRVVAYTGQVLRVAVEVVRKPAGQQSCAVQPHRWLVERTLVWVVRCRRLDHDYERLPATAEAMTKCAMIGMAQHLAPVPGRPPWQAIARA